MLGALLAGVGAGVPFGKEAVEVLEQEHGTEGVGAEGEERVLRVDLRG